MCVEKSFTSVYLGLIIVLQFEITCDVILKLFWIILFRRFGFQCNILMNSVYFKLDYPCTWIIPVTLDYYILIKCNIGLSTMQRIYILSRVATVENVTSHESAVARREETNHKTTTNILRCYMDTIIGTMLLLIW